jgi:Bacterial membrane protein YfhO
MGSLRDRFATPCTMAVLAVGLTLGGLLVGYEPVSGDPDTMYRPIKSELARALRAGHLPFWSDHFGLGVPLLAESHAATLYPPNLLFYRFLDVARAYRLAMWLHFVAIALATYAYARCLETTPWGASLAALSFSLCGFLSSHASHEPFYHALPFLPLALLLTERYVSSGRLVWLPLLALTWGLQLTVGHFQIPMWTGGLVLLIGLWRVHAGRRPWRRALGLCCALGWGAAIAAVQLSLTQELARVAGFDRPYKFLANYSFPPAHWAQLALPRFFMGLRGGTEDPYWGGQQTTGAEACFYIGTVPLILACVGLTARRDRALAPWRLIAPMGFLLATLPRLWPEGFLALLHVPGFGYFRAPGRYTLLASLGLCLLAGRGLDRTLPPRRFAVGMALAALFGAAAAGWTVAWAQRPDLRASLGDEAIAWRLGEAAIAWSVGLIALTGWRLGRVGPWAPFVIAAVELALLFYHGATVWGWSIPLPEASPMLSRLMREPNVGLIAGPLADLPVRAGLTPAFPYLGITPPPPNYLLEDAKSPEKSSAPGAARWMRRFGVTHGVWEASAEVRGSKTLYLGPDLALDLLATRDAEAPEHVSWRLVSYADAFPPAHVALESRVAADWFDLFPRLSRTESRDEVWFMVEDQPPADPSPRAHSARLLRWDGHSGEVEHDGTCYLVIRRTYYPGWLARVNDRTERSVIKADGGLQAVLLPGKGLSRVSVRYRPTDLMPMATLSTAALVSALGMIGLDAVRRSRFCPRWTQDRPATSQASSKSAEQPGRGDR